MPFTIEPFQVVSVLLLEGLLTFFLFLFAFWPGGEVFGILDTTCMIS